VFCVIYLLLSDVSKVTVRLKNTTEGMLVDYYSREQKENKFYSISKKKNKNFLHIITGHGL